MSVSILCFLLIMATFLLFFQYRVASLVLSLYIIVYIMLVGTGIVPYLLIRADQVPFEMPPNFQWQKNNIIVLLGGGVRLLPPEFHQAIPVIAVYSRINMAARLYAACHAKKVHCRLLISGGPDQVGSTTVVESIVYSKLLEQLGVEHKDMLLESYSRNTYQNAHFIRMMLQRLPTQQLLLVTSGMHMKRALRLFHLADLYPIPIAADYVFPDLAKNPNAYNFFLTDMIVHEYLGQLAIDLAHWLGVDKATHSSFAALLHKRLLG